MSQKKRRLAKARRILLTQEHAMAGTDYAFLAFSLRGRARDFSKAEVRRLLKAARRVVRR
ncbi:MAG: hypothetical protein A3J48_03805 [Candidatus Doudnabacteria bacterium RIFCSPHIGHO2_02_FULL_46_11]|uniref:Uncharacterized protein n=1 Tax=Candidatus Doudnabacteria bacterium RIFCSPHIGHO2_02_FULL_46_11 TaxID=1817832 RepID=A0A1F5P4C6_9BACT|nr:MAG: hypothetical protein A3J48_03805 [Candidatus Doudnabacteria bacterium RIFCSPHIGHO2_02_FULL_46_11]